MNETDYAGLHHDARLSTFTLPAPMYRSFVNGRVEVIPAAYHGASRILTRTVFAVAFAHVSAPDDKGRCSFGIAADFAPLVWMQAARRVLLVNSRMPVLPRAPWLSIADADVVVDAEGPLIGAPRPQEDETSDRIGRLITEIVPDYAAIQTGIGTLPSAVWSRLASHKGLALRSGLVPDGFMTLVDADAPGDPNQHVAAIALARMHSTGFWRSPIRSPPVRPTRRIRSPSLPNAIGFTRSIRLFRSIF